MEVDAVQDEWAYGSEGRPPKATPPADPPGQPAGELVHSLGYGPTQGAIGKSGKGYNGGGCEKGKGAGKDWKGEQKGKGAGRRQG